MAVFRQQTLGSKGIEWKTTVVGLEAAFVAARAYGVDVAREMAAALYREGQRIRAASMEEVPVDLGVLRSTAHVELSQATAGEVLVEIGYGGPAAQYALRQHEELDYRHTVGKAKYLEDPFRRAVPTMDQRLADDIRRKAGARK